VNPSGSGLERGIMCPASFALAQANATTTASIVGTENHEKIEIGMVGGDLSGLPPVVANLLEGATEVDVEVAFALDVETRTVRLLGRRLNREYGKLAPAEIALTLDVIITRPGEVLVVDWKSRKRVATAKKNWQLRAQAVAVMAYLGLPVVMGAIAYLDDGEVDAHMFDAFDSAAFWEDMSRMLNKIGAARALVATGGIPAVHTGSWCEYCPALSYCPAQTSLARSMLGELHSIEQTIAFMSAEQCGKAWELLGQIQAIAERVDASLRLRARQEPLPLADGSVIAAVECKGRMVTNNDAIRARFEQLGEPVPMRRGADYVQIKKVTRKKEKAA
jgi:hypothetical protein